MENKNKEVLEKIKKLLTLAGNNPSKEEAELAAQKAHQLLLKHNLNMSQVKLSESEPYSATVIKEHAKQTVLFTGISYILRQHYLVELYYRPRYKYSKIEIFGTPNNVEIGQYVFSFLEREIPRLWLSYKRETGASMRAKNSFILGVIRGLDDKLKESANKFKVEYGIVPANSAVAELRKDNRIKQQNTTVPNRDNDAREAGYDQGRNLTISAGIGHETKHSGLSIAL